MEDHEEVYLDDIKSKDKSVPKFLILTYAILPIWGLFSLYYYWNGSAGWLDRGYWSQLQRAANTTLPEVNYTELEAQKQKQNS
jgi:hypothetical protein